MKAKIEVSFADEKTAKAIARSVSPDNIKTPDGLKVKTKVKGVKVISTIDCETRIETFIATIDDLLLSIQTAEKALKAI